MQCTTVEIIMFGLNNGVNEADFVAANQPVDEWVKAQPGFCYRSLTQNPESKLWSDIVYWDTLENAKAAFTKFNQVAANKAWTEMIDATTVQVQHTDIKAQCWYDSQETSEAS